MFLMCYETEDSAVLRSPAYRAALDAPTAWTLASLAHVRNAVRAVYRLPLEAKTLGAIKPLFDTAQRWLQQLVQRGRELGTIRRDLPDDMGDVSQCPACWLRRPPRFCAVKPKTLPLRPMHQPLLIPKVSRAVCAPD